MSGIISENYLSRPFTVGLTQNGRELVFDIQNAVDETDVFDLVAGAAPAVYQGLILDSIAGDPVSDVLWKGYARYVRLEDQNEYTFDTGGGTAHRTQSISTINSYAIPGLTPGDFQGSIGVSEDRVEGVDVTSPNFTFSETHLMSDTIVNLGYKQLLFQMTGTVNNATFKGLDAGEALFQGASGTQKGFQLQWSITYRFAGSENASGITLGDITGIDKDGWDYLWIRYGDYEDSTAKALVKRPISCYVERVYPRTDFSTLLIGT